MSHVQNTPKFIKQVPWYARDNDGKTQSTNKLVSQQIPMKQWYQRGKKGFQANTFRKGACQNCGAMGHIKRDCTQRPRKIGAKYTNQKISADDQMQQVKLTWQSKRDRWNGFDAEMYKEVIQQHEQYQQVRKKIKPNQNQDDDELVTKNRDTIQKDYKMTQNPLDLANLPTKNIKNQKFTGLGNIRNRQQKAKYLMSLDLNGPYFDPKSRAMKGDLVVETVEQMGDKAELREQLTFASEQQEKYNAEINSMALPTLTQKIYKSVKQKNNFYNPNNKQKNVSHKYDAQTGQLRKAQLIVYQQKDDFQFNLLNSMRKQQTVKSRYPENILNNDHTKIWGSWYSKILGWGYGCCYGVEKTGYCLGEKGKEKTLARELKLKAEMLRKEEKLAEILEDEVEEDKE